MGDSFSTIKQNPAGRFPEKENIMSRTSYGISISRNGIWAGDGIYDHTDTPDVVAGNIRDCSAVLGGDQETAEKIYEAIEDAITEGDQPMDGEIKWGEDTYSWTLTTKSGE